jgi:beta-galactosidase
MTNKLLFIATILILSFCKPATAQRIVADFNADWKFTLENQPEAFKTEFNDKDWVTLNLPHDWAIEQGISREGAQAENGGYFGGGIGWYRKSFDVSTEWLSKNVTINFEGVYMNSEVWINGHYLGKRPYGYISFRYELSKYIKEGKNTIAVRVDNSLEPSARWYHPCGIYAPVQLIVKNHQAITENGIYVTTPDINKDKAIVQIKCSLENKKDLKGKALLETTIINANGKIVAQNNTPFKWSDTLINLSTILSVDNPELWSPSSPTLYKTISKVLVKKQVIDKVETRFGIRSIEWKTESGFWLNGEVTKLLGVSEHYEGGPIGGAWTKPLLRWKLALLKEMGVNAIRTAHNPAPPMFYELCDELGILVMDEIFDGWKRKAPQDYGMQAFNEWWKEDLTEWITRNRNHPSIIIYSVGNETHGEIAKDLVELCHKLDPTKPVTSGHSNSKQMDVFGVNGGSEKTGFFNQKRLDKPFVSTEAPHTWQTRGYYRTITWYRDGKDNPNTQYFELPNLTDKEIFHYEWAPQSKWTNHKQHFNSSYDNATVRISARKNWEIMRDSAWFSGHFRWTGFDYYGEAGYVHGGWPFRLFMGGALDAAGFEKDLFYFYKSQWTTEPMIHILPHWTHPTMEQGTEIPVWVYSNCDEVELFLNGKSLGKDKPGTKWNEMQCEWLVPFEKGTLTAVAYNKGKEIVRTSQITAATPASLNLSIDNKYINTNKDNIAIITTAINDSVNVLYPYGENTIYYHFDGNVSVLSHENGDPVDTAKNYGVNYRRAFMGLTKTFIETNKQSENIALTAGAILGEKQLLTSNKVYIDVKTIAIKGKVSEQMLSIFYTLDGTEPTSESNEYKGAFSIALGTTVKAIVVRDKQVILNMHESFDKALGLCWNEQAEYNPNNKINGMRAVDADFEGATKQSYKNAKYLDFGGQEGKITWYQENDGSAGEFNLTFSYGSKDKDSKRPMDLIINGKKVTTICFEPSESWNSNWKQVITKQRLGAGANYIELQTTGQSAPNIWLLYVE